MEDKIALLTEQLFNDGVQKAKEEASLILAKAEKDSKTILEQAHREATAIVEQARVDSEDLRKNTEEEIRASGAKAISLIKQRIADALTLKVSQEFVGDEVKVASLPLLFYAIDKMVQINGEDHLNALLPESLESDLKMHLEKSLHDQYKNNVALSISQKIDSGFRIGPSSKNYIISFTEDDFIHFFSQLLRPKTAEILFGNDRI